MPLRVSRECFFMVAHPHRPCRRCRPARLPSDVSGMAYLLRPMYRKLPSAQGATYSFTARAKRAPVRRAASRRLEPHGIAGNLHNVAVLTHPDGAGGKIKTGLVRDVPGVPGARVRTVACGGGIMVGLVAAETKIPAQPERRKKALSAEAFGAILSALVNTVPWRAP